MATPTEGQKKLVLSTDDVLRILRASAKCGVEVLKFHDLQVKFGKQTKPVDLPDQPNQSPAQSSAVAEMTDQQRSELSKEVQEQMEFDMRDSQLEEALITNPSHFEEMVNNGELDEDDDDAVGAGDESE